MIGHSKQSVLKQKQNFIYKTIFGRKNENRYHMIRYEGMKALREKLGIVEAERFISLILRESFDYTEWQRDLWKDKSIDELFNAAKTYTSGKE